MKKILLALLALIIALTLVACNTGNDGKDTTDTEKTTTAKVTDDDVDDEVDDEEDDDDGTDITTDTQSTEQSTDNTETTVGDNVTTTAATTTNNGDTVIVPNNSVFEAALKKNNNFKDMPFIDAFAELENLIATPVAIEDNSESYRISFTFEMASKLSEATATSEMKIPVTLDYTYIKNGDFALKLSAMEQMSINVFMVDGVIYMEVTDPNTGDTLKGRMEPTEQELIDFENRLGELISSMDIEGMLGSFGYVSNVPGNELTYSNNLETYNEEISVSVGGGKLEYDPDYEIVTGEPDVGPMAALFEEIVADVFANEAPVDIIKKLLGDANVFYDANGNLHIAAKGGFEYLESKLTAIGAALDEKLPQESIDALELPQGYDIEKLLSMFNFKTNSNLVEIVCKPDGTVVALGFDLGFVAENSGDKVELDLALALGITVDPTLSVKAPANKNEYELTTLDALMTAIEEAVASMGPSNDFIDSPEIDISGMTAEDLGLVPGDNGIIYLNDDPYKRAHQLMYILESEDPTAEFDCIFSADVCISGEYEIDNDSYGYFAVVPSGSEDDPYYYMSEFAFESSTNSYKVGQTTTVFFTIVLDEYGFPTFVDASVK